jgi:hypothetical protein
MAKINDAARSAELVNSKYEVSAFTVDVKKFTAQTEGAVDKFEANADAYVQAQNIIYESDVTARKLQDAGVERAIGLEASFAADIRKSESQTFVALDRSANSIRSREVERRASIRMEEARQLNTQGYTAYEHGRNNEARSYEAVAVSDAEYTSSAGTYGERNAWAVSVAEARIQVAKDTSAARNEALLATTSAQIDVSAAKTSASVQTATAEQDLIIQASYDKNSATIDQMYALSDAQIEKIMSISTNTRANKQQELLATSTVYAEKAAAHQSAIHATAASRATLTQERINSIESGYTKVTGAKIDVSSQELQARKDAMALGREALAQVIQINNSFLDTSLSNRLSKLTEINNITFTSEQTAAQIESNARIQALGVTSTADVKAATDRASASLAALDKRHQATFDAAQAMNTAAIDMTKAKIKIASDNLSAKNIKDEEITGNNNSTRLAVEASTQAAQITIASLEASNTLAGMVALNDARLAASQKNIDTETATREAELNAQLEAQGITLSAEAYANRKRLEAQSYMAAINMKSQSITSYNRAVMDGQTRITGLLSNARTSAGHLMTSYWEAVGSQTSRRDLYHYSTG